MEQTCARAVELGLDSVAFTDHADFTQCTVLAEPDVLPDFIRAMMRGGTLRPPPLDLDGYLGCLQECRDKFPQLKILAGVELSEPHWHREAATALLRQANFDLVVCGLHSLPHDRGTFIDVADGFVRNSPADLVREYLTQITGLIQAWDDFTVLAHIDYPVRMWRRRYGAFEPAGFEEEYRIALRALASTGKVLEINTRLPLDPVIIGWWHQEGGSAVSFGSDAHYPLNLAHGFAEAAAVAQSCGFKPGQTRHDFWTRA